MVILMVGYDLIVLDSYLMILVGQVYFIDEQC